MAKRQFQIPMIYEIDERKKKRSCWLALWWLRLKCMYYCGSFIFSFFALGPLCILGVRYAIIVQLVSPMPVFGAWMLVLSIIVLFPLFFLSIPRNGSLNTSSRRYIMLTETRVEASISSGLYYDELKHVSFFFYPDFFIIAFDPKFGGVSTSIVTETTQEEPSETTEEAQISENAPSPLSSGRPPISMHMQSKRGGWLLF